MSQFFRSALLEANLLSAGQLSRMKRLPGDHVVRAIDGGYATEGFQRAGVFYIERILTVIEGGKK